MRVKLLVVLVATFAMLSACGVDRELANPGYALHTNTWSIVAANSETGRLE
jgi:hypothetical protein